MMQLIGTGVCIAWIVWLFLLDRDEGARPSTALWIPTVWLLIDSSRGVSTWFHLTPVGSLADQYTEGSPIDAAIYGILIAAGAMVLNFRARQVKAFIHRNLPLMVFFAFCALSICWSEYPFIALKRWSKSVGDLVMLMVVLTDLHPKLAVRRLFARLAFLLLPLSVLFIECYPELGSAYNPDDMVMMYFGVTTFKNLLGMISMVLGLASLWSFIGAYEHRDLVHRTRHLVAHGLTVATALWLIVKADSMTSLSCFVLAGAVMILSTQRWITRWRGSVHLIVGAAIALPLFALFVNTVGTLVHSLGRNSTLTGRTSIWRAVLSIHTNPLVGTGFESFWLGNRLQAVWNMSVKGIQEAHNGYIELYLNLGWIGICLLAWLIISGYRSAMASLRNDPSDGQLRLAYLCAALIFSMTEAGFRMLSPIWFAFLLAIPGIPENAQLSEGIHKPEVSWIQGTEIKRLRILQ